MEGCPGFLGPAASQEARKWNIIRRCVLSNLARARQWEGRASSCQTHMPMLNVGHSAVGSSLGIGTLTG